MTTRHLRWQLIGVLLMIFLVGGCGTFAPTPEPPTATPTPVPPTPTPFTEVGDPERGREIFEDGGGALTVNFCSNCHSLDGSVATEAHLRAPTFQGISERAGERVPGMSAVDYLRQSIVDPSAYVVEDFSDHLMPDSYKLVLNEEDIDNLVAFMLTQ